MDIKSRIHRLLDSLSEEELQIIWPMLEELYYDFYLLRAIQQAKQEVKPGDSFTREEAVRFLRS